MTPKTLLECCKRAKEYKQEHELADDFGASIGVSLQRTLEHRIAVMKEFEGLCDAAKDKDWGKYLLGLSEVLYQVCNLTQEAGLETVLSAAFSLKHAANMSQTCAAEEAMDTAIWMSLSPEAAQKCIKATPSGRFALSH